MSFFILLIIVFIIISKKKAGQPDQRNQQLYAQMQNQRNQQPRPQMQIQRNQQPRPQMQNQGMSQNVKSRPASSYAYKEQNSSAKNGIQKPAPLTASGSKRMEPASVSSSEPVPGTTEPLQKTSLSMEGTLYIPNEPSTLLLGMVEYDQRFGGF